MILWQANWKEKNSMKMKFNSNLLIIFLVIISVLTLTLLVNLFLSIINNSQNSNQYTYNDNNETVETKSVIIVANNLGIKEEFEEIEHLKRKLSFYDNLNTSILDSEGDKVLQN